MRQVVLLASSIALLGAVSIAAWRFGVFEKIFDQSNGAIAACEDGLVRSLRSPSSYSRIAIEFTPAPPLSESEHVAYQETQGCPMALQENGGWDGCILRNRLGLAYGTQERLKSKNLTHPSRRQRQTARAEVFSELYRLMQSRPLDRQHTAFVKIEYDASNAYGALMRQSEICRFGPHLYTEQFSEKDMFSVLGDEEYHGK